MARRGRTPAPHALKLLKGERADRMPVVASPPDRPPECPAWLDAVAREEWGRMVEDLAPTVALTAVAAKSLAVYCDAYSRLQLARKDIAEHGVSILTDNGSLKTNPAVGTAKDAHATMLRVLAELARAPAVAPEAEVDELSEFLAM